MENPATNAKSTQGTAPAGSDSGPASGRVKVKICGITNLDDAERATDLGADALGFNFFPGSSRFVPVAEAQRWLPRLAPWIIRVGVFVNPTWDEVESLTRRGLIDAVQLHGDEDLAFCARCTAAGMRLVKAFRVRDETSLRDAERYPTRDLLLDAFSPGHYGGTGHVADWELAAGFTREHPECRVILSGGLHGDNVGSAVVRVRPYGVDVASGVEISGEPRRKDPAKMRSFLRAVALKADGHVAPPDDHCRAR